MIVTTDFNDLIKDAQFYLDRACEFSNPELVRDSLLCYSSVFSTMNDWGNPTDLQKFNLLTNLYDTYVRNSKLWDSICFFNDSLVKNDIFQCNNSIINYILDNYSYKQINGNKLSNDELFIKLDEFYKRFDKRVYKVFREAMDSDNNTLFLTSLNLDRDVSDDGITINADGLEKRIVFIDNTNDFRTLITLVHEFGHMISSYNNKVTRDDYEPYSEIEGLFPEFVVLYENIMNSNDISACYNLINNLTNCLDGIKAIAEQDKLLKLWESNRFDTGETLDKLLKSNGIGKKKYKNIMNYDYYYDSLYGLGIMITLKLLYIFRRSKKDALTLYKYIVLGSRKRQEDAIKEIENIDSIKEIDNIHDDVQLVLNNKRH